MSEKAMEETKDFYKYQILDSDEKVRLTLELPTYPDNCGWFRVAYPDGRAYTLMGLDDRIEDYIKDHRFTDGTYDGDVEADEDTEYVELKQELVKVVSSRVDSVTARNIVDELWGQFKIERPDC